MSLHVVVGQLAVDWEPARNAQRVVSFLHAECTPGGLAVLPEAALSGYDDDLSGLAGLDAAALREAHAAVGDAAAELGVHVLAGSLLPADGGWCNAALYFGPQGERWVYHKVNLATHERGRLVAGAALPLLDLQAGPEAVHLSVGVQLCRELKFPEQWLVLARRGASVLAYLTYAANPRVPAGVWRSHLISRAAETQRFVLAANVASPVQHCPSMVISPDGVVLAETTTTGPAALHADLDLTQTSGWLLSQQRGDVVTVSYRR